MRDLGHRFSAWFASAVGSLVILLLVGCETDASAHRRYMPEERGPSVRAPGYSETAPGFELPKSSPLVFIGTPQNPTPFQQKVALSLKRVVMRQGGVLAQDPRQADLFLIAGAEKFEDVQIRNVPQPDASGNRAGRAFALALGDIGASLSGQPNWARYNIERQQLLEDVKRAVPEQEIVKTVYCYASIEMYAPVGGRLQDDASNLSHVWHAEMQVPYEEFQAKMEYWINALFERFGSPDGKFTAYR